MLTPLAFDPSKVDLHQTEVGHPRHIHQHIIDMDKLTGDYQPRDFKVFLKLKEVDKLRQLRTIPCDNEMYEDAILLMVRALMSIEGFDQATAQYIISVVIEAKSALEIIKQERKACTDALALLLDVTGTLYKRVDFRLYEESMRLHMEDYQAIFPNRMCNHDPALVLHRLRNSRYRVTDEERRRHLKQNRASSFGIIGSLSMWDVMATKVMDEMVMLQNAGRYQAQKVAYDAAEAAVDDDPKTAALKDELNGVIIN